MTQMHPIPAVDQGYHYGVMRRAIDLIDQAEDPMQLDKIAKQMGMSPAHFQRLFSRWVGVSPKRYQQYLMLGQAKAMLHGQSTTLQAAHSLGLSGTGRLHDLFLRWEAMSPGAFARKGADLTINWGWFDSPFGRALVMGTDRGICGLALAAPGKQTRRSDSLGKPRYESHPAHLGRRGGGMARTRRRRARTRRLRCRPCPPQRARSGSYCRRRARRIL